MEHRDGQLAGPSSATKRWESIQASGSAHLHNGDIYNISHNYATPGRVTEQEDERREQAWRRDLLGWLTFAEISDRREQVHEAHQKTYKWIFEADHETGFATWLSCGNGIFWIYGKPGSGKSTLMKFIAEEPHLLDLLDVWAGDKPLLMASFWFWIAGTKLQRSLVGLYRTLLYQMLKAECSLCRIAFSDWQPRFRDTEPTWEMLTAAMKRVLAFRTASSRFFLMIDGLDEYEADTVGKVALAELMQCMAQSPMVKLLVSSRPEGPFQHCFRKRPRLRLEALTGPDILRYVEEKLWSNSSVRTITDAEKHDIQEIGEEIITSAEGVFLWVVLVLHIVIDSINSYEHLSDLRLRIKFLPSKLNDLFTHILTYRVAPHHQLEASRYLLIAFECNTGDRISCRLHSASAVIAMAQQASSYEKTCHVASLDVKEIKATLANFKGHLESRCHGLLECKPSNGDRDIETSHVVFLHRTLFDYLQIAETQNSLLNGVNKEFDVFTAIMAGLACKAQLGQQSRDARQDMAIAFFDANAQAELNTGRHNTELVTVFDRILTDKIPPKSQYVSEHWSETEQMIPQSQCENDLLAFVAYMGGTLYLQEAIKKKTVSCTGDRLSILLHLTLPPSETTKKCYGIQLSTATLLLECGANPCFRLQGVSVWEKATQFLSKTNPQMIANSAKGISLVTEYLQLVLLMVKLAREPENFSLVADGIFSSQSVPGRVLKAFLDARCCLDNSCIDRRSLRDCDCAKSQAWVPRALEILQLLATQVPNSEKSCSEERLTLRSKLRGFRFKGILSLPYRRPAPTT